MAAEKKKDFFWLSYADVMTSLFFVMLVLFVLVYSMQNSVIKELAAAKEELDEIHRIQAALEKLDKNYYVFDKRNKRYKLRADVNFNPNSSDIKDIPLQIRTDVLNAGQGLFSLMENLTKENPNVNYLLVIEGNTQRSINSLGNWNHIHYPNLGYKLSYERALALVNYWKSNNLDFKRFDNCEIIIAGSGYFGKARENKEVENRKFSIQITPKIGEFKKKSLADSLSVQ